MKLTVVVLALLAAAVFRLVPLVFAGQEPRVYPRTVKAAVLQPITVPTEAILEP